MAGGIAGGWFLLAGGERPGLHTAIGRLQSAGTVALLFSMGVWLGINDEFWENLSTIGLRGMLFSLATILGSVLVVYLIANLFFKKNPDDDSGA
jgi:hypothetical protein